MIESIYGDILVYIHSRPSDKATSAELVSRFGPDVIPLASRLAEDGLLDFDYLNNTFRLQAKGRPVEAEYAFALQQRRQQEAQQKAAQDRQQSQAAARQEYQQRQSFRHDYLVALFEALIAFLVGVLVEHYAQLYQRLLDLLR